MRIAGFNDRGEARIIDEHGRLVGYGELRLQDAHITGIERGDRFAVEVHVTWTAAEAAAERDAQPDSLPDPDQIDFDDLDFGQLLGG